MSTGQSNVVHWKLTITTWIRAFLRTWMTSGAWRFGACFMAEHGAMIVQTDVALQKVSFAS